MTNQQFVSRMREACDHARSKGAQFNEAVLFAQAALESGWGNSDLTQKANNLFGIKAGENWAGGILAMPTKEWSPQHGWYSTTANWRQYLTWDECIMDYARIIAGLPWFKDALQHLDSADDFLKALLPEPGQYGWATDPTYFEKVFNVGKAIQSLGGPEWV